MADAIPLKAMSILCLIFCMGCSSSEPPTCSDADVQNKAWKLFINDYFARRTAFSGGVMSMGSHDSPTSFLVTATGLIPAFSFTMSSERTAKYDSSTHKRWCQADLRVQFDVRKVDPSAINNPPGRAHFEDSDVPSAMEYTLKFLPFPSVIEYAIQRTDDGGTYVSLESAP